MMRIIDKNYNAVDIISNDTPSGINFKDDRLKITLQTGLYTLEFKVDKINLRHTNIELGNMIEYKTRHGKQLLLTITSINSDNPFSKTIFAEDATITILNGFVDPIEKPKGPQRLSYYVNHVLEKTNYKLKTDESEGDLFLEFGQTQRRLERLRAIADAFNVELSFSVDFTPGEPPKLSVDFFKKRQEYKESFRVSTDDLLVEPERNRNFYNVTTRMLVQGAQIQDKNKTATSTSNSGTVTPPTEPVIPQVDTFAEAMIKKAFEIKALRKPYQWGGNGNPSWDCSGFMQACIQAAGQRINHRATTYTMRSQYAPFKVIPLNDIKRGDLLMYDTGYTHPGDWNHVGLFLGKNRSELGNPNTVIHAGNPVGSLARANSMKIMGAVRVTRP